MFNGCKLISLQLCFAFSCYHSIYSQRQDNELQAEAGREDATAEVANSIIFLVVILIHCSTHYPDTK